jgi:hypothetical protein
LPTHGRPGIGSEDLKGTAGLIPDLPRLVDETAVEAAGGDLAPWEVGLDGGIDRNLGGGIPPVPLDRLGAGFSDDPIDEIEGCSSEKNPLCSGSLERSPQTCEGSVKPPSRGAAKGSNAVRCLIQNGKAQDRGAGRCGRGEGRVVEQAVIVGKPDEDWRSQAFPS